MTNAVFVNVVLIRDILSLAKLNKDAVLQKMLTRIKESMLANAVMMNLNVKRIFIKRHLKSMIKNAKRRNAPRKIVRLKNAKIKANIERRNSLYVNSMRRNGRMIAPTPTKSANSAKMRINAPRKNTTETNTINLVASLRKIVFIKNILTRLHAVKKTNAKPN